MKKKLLYFLMILGINQMMNAQTATGLHFEATSLSTYDYISVPDNNDLDLTTSFTFESWVNFDQISPSAAGLDWRAFFNKSRYNDAYGLMILVTNKTMRFYHKGMGSGFTDYTWSGLTANTWYHVAVSVSATEAKIYIDGTEVKSNTFAASTLDQNDEPLLIGASRNVAGDPYPFDGQMDDVRLWNVTRTAAQIMSDKNCQLDGTESGLVLNFDLDQGTVDTDNTSITTVTDKTTNGLNGTLIGFDLTGAEGNFVDTATGNGVSGTCGETLSSNTIKVDNEALNISPNPVSQGVFEIQNLTNNTIKALFIYDLSGKVVKQITSGIFNQPISVSSLSSGIYFVKVDTSETTIVKKLIID